ncbi:MAG: NUDIX hydrolase [Bacillota bacterium]
MVPLLNQKGQTLEQFLKAYKEHEKDKYEKPSVTVDTLIFTVKDKEIDNYRKLPKKELMIMMIKRKDHPFIGQWAIPGGFVNIDEDIYESAKRELREETNIDNIYMEQLYTWGDVGRDPRMRIISVSYMALINSDNLSVKAGDDAEEAEWFSVNLELIEDNKKLVENRFAEVAQLFELKLINNKDETLSAKIKVEHKVVNSVAETTTRIVESNGIAFDHGKIIFYSLQRLRNKIEYTDIAFQLMPEYFTLTELQKVYEVILGEKLYPAQFRRQIEPMVIKTDKMHAEGKGHRPAVLYKFNPLWRLE